jgi:tRNA 2-selenouridine synthase
MHTEDFIALNSPILDVRSPQEYAQGHFPGAISFPLFTDAERAEVGTVYKQVGREEAVRLGLRLIGPKLASLVEEADNIACGAKHLRLYCWRGGMRSGSVAWLLSTAGYRCAVLTGGYKAFRRWALAQFAKPYPLNVLGGLTGCGKTEILLQKHAKGEQVIDLEGIASHRGSCFGHLGKSPQPTCEHFTNLLAWELSKCSMDRPIWIEDESRMIGTCQIPQLFWEQMSAAHFVWVEASKEERVERLMHGYGAFARENLIASIMKIERRLGSLRTKEIISNFDEGHIQAAIENILTYYDQAYLHSCARRSRHIPYCNI